MKKLFQGQTKTDIAPLRLTLLLSVRPVSVWLIKSYLDIVIHQKHHFTSHKKAQLIDATKRSPLALIHYFCCKAVVFSLR